MRVLIIDSDGVGVATALRASELGHDVKLFIEPKPDNNADITGKGFDQFEIVKEWLPYAMKSDLIIATVNTNYLDKLNAIRKKGRCVWAPTKEVADLEIKRGVGLKFFEDHDLLVPEYNTFKTLEEAKDFVMDNEPQPWVFKTMGDEDDKSLSFVSKNAAQMVEQINQWIEQKMKLKGQCLLQKKIDGVEFAVSAWVGLDGFVGPFQHCWEHKKLFNDEIGPNTGEQGSIVQFVKESKLGETILRPLEKDLAKMGAFCNFDLNCIIDKKGDPYILEATCRFGYPTWPIQMGLFNGDWVQMLYDACEGVDTFDVSYDYGVGIVLTIPDAPYYNFEREKTVGFPIYGVDDKNQTYIQPQGVMMGEYVDGDDFEEVENWVTAGSYVAVVIEKGKTIEDAREKVYEIVDQLSISNMMYRTDIGLKVIKSIPELKKHGYVLNSK